MKIKFQTDVPFWERCRILWHGRVYVYANYKGQFDNKPMKIELGAVSRKIQKQQRENNVD